MTSVDVDQLRAALLDLWFAPEVQPQWFQPTIELDERLRSEFATAVERAGRGELDGLLASPEGSLALCLLLDQLPRNIWRGTPRAFAFDARARAVADQALAAGHDLAVRPDGRVFFYLPFEHSEDLADQERSVALFQPLGGVYLDYAIRHREVIVRFGRFPHRNRILSRPSTAEEEAFLKEPGSSF